MIKK
ncbi:hypothetical protein, partial [Plasmodium yoelii yoelii]|jgi:hypothetical protein